MAFKGQNLRIFIGDKCLAASTSCEFDCEAIVENITTKDDVDDWQRNECTGKKFTVSVDALYVNSGTEARQVDCVNNRIKVGSVWVYPSSSMFAVEPGNTISVPNPGATTLFYEFVNNSPVAIGSAKSNNSWTNETASTKYVYFGITASSYSDETYPVIIRTDLSYGRTIENIIGILKTNTEIKMAFAVADGAHNATASEVIAQGNVVCTKITVNSQNQSPVTYTAQFEGKGELTFGSSARAKMTAMVFDDEGTEGDDNEPQPEEETGVTEDESE